MKKKNSYRKIKVLSAIVLCISLGMVVRAENFDAPWDGLNKPIAEQADRDKTIFINTMFPNLNSFAILRDKLNDTQMEYTINKMNFIKRVFLTVAYLELKYISESTEIKQQVIQEFESDAIKYKKYHSAKQAYEAETNVEKRKEKKHDLDKIIDKEYYNKLQKEGQEQYWPHPISMVFAHGQRVLIDIKVDFDPVKFYEFLLSGLLDGGNSKIGHSRAAASHGVELDDEKLVEVKLGGVSALFGGHHGINIPLGGMGSIDGKGNVIGPGGKGISKELFDFNESGNISKFKTPQTKLSWIDKRQHGHFYIKTTDLSSRSKKRAYLLMGIEGSAHGKKNMFDVAHTIGSAEEDQTKKMSATGGNKWQSIPGLEANQIPSEYGGKRVNVTELGRVRSIERVCAMILYMLDDETQKKVFTKLLGKTGLQAKTYLYEVKDSIKKVLKENSYLMFYNSRNIWTIANEFMILKMNKMKYGDTEFIRKFGTTHDAANIRFKKLAGELKIELIEQDLIDE